MEFHNHAHLRLEWHFEKFLDRIRSYHHALICQKSDMKRKVMRLGGKDHTEIESLKAKCQKVEEFRDRMEKIYHDVFGVEYNMDNWDYYDSDSDED